MRLKVSTKVAIEKIDVLVREGADMLAWLSETYEKTEAAAKDEKEELKRQRERQMQERAAVSPFGTSIARLSAYDTYLDFWNSDTRAAQQGMKEIEDRFADWLKRTKEALKAIYIDFTPVYAFLNSFGTHYHEPIVDGMFRRYVNIKREMEAKVDKLIVFYDALVNNVRSPLNYIPNEAKLCFYDLVCPLRVDSNEAALCTFMFQHSVGEKVEMVDAYNHIFGEQGGMLSATDRDKIENAYDGINRKTNRAFGFPVMSKDKTTLSLTLPNRVTANLS